MRLDPENNCYQPLPAWPWSFASDRPEESEMGLAVKTDPRHDVLSGDTTTISSAVQPRVCR
jgi:hypothetical protein